METLDVEQHENGNWLYVASLNDGIFFHVGVEETEGLAREAGENVMHVLRSRRKAYDEAVGALAP